MVCVEPVQLRRVLHVEDDESIIAITRVALETVSGLQVASCDSGRQAIERAASFDPDVVLVDVMMPDMDGPETVAGLAHVLAFDRVPIVFMTAKTDATDHAQYYALGAAEIIVKPFDPLALGARIHEIWERFHAAKRE